MQAIDFDKEIFFVGLHLAIIGFYYYWILPLLYVFLFSCILVECTYSNFGFRNQFELISHGCLVLIIQG